MLQHFLSKTDCLNLLDVCSETISNNPIENSFSNAINSLQKVIPFNYAICVKGYDSISADNIINPKHHVHFDEKNEPVKTFEAINYNYPLEWVQTYRVKRFYRLDPIMIENFSNFGYQRWTDTFKKSPPPQKFVSIAADFDLVKGCTYGVRASVQKMGSLFSIAGKDVEYSKRTDIVIKYITPHIHNLLLRGSREVLSIYLTRRELEVLKWVCNGKSSWEIGKILHISENTVNFHIKNINLKLGTVNRPQMVAKAIFHGFVGIEDIL
jgi:DNA-binding CsgD family transcriptional regulator